MSSEGEDLRPVDPPPKSARPVRSSRRLYIAAGGVLVVVLVAALLAPRVFGSSDDDDEAAVSDDFARTGGDGLGSVDGQEWEEVSGTFTIEDGAAVVEEPNDAGPRTVTLLDGGATNARVEAVIGRATPGWGLVFRYANPFNYWYLQAAPDFAVVNVVRMFNGEPQTIGASDLARLADGVTVVVDLSGTSIEVEVDGEVVFVLTSDHCLGATKAGLVGLGDPAGASWDSFSIFPDADDPGPTELKLPPVPTTTEDESSTTDTSEDSTSTTTERTTSTTRATTTTSAPGG